MCGTGRMSYIRVCDVGYGKLDGRGYVSPTPDLHGCLLVARTGDVPPASSTPAPLSILDRLFRPTFSWSIRTRRSPNGRTNSGALLPLSHCCRTAVNTSIVASPRLPPNCCCCCCCRSRNAVTRDAPSLKCCNAAPFFDLRSTTRRMLMLMLLIVLLMQLIALLMQFP